MSSGKPAERGRIDRAMVIASIARYLEDGVLREHFHGTSIESRPERLLSEEEFPI